jgi:hypothetical protein
MRLFPQHAALLRASAISPEVALARNYVSVDVKTRLEQAGFAKSQRNVPGLLIPVWGVTGAIASYEYRPDQPRVLSGRTLRYEKPKGSANAIDVSPLVNGQLRDASAELWIAEGARKCDSAITAGLTCIGLAGVWCWRGTDKNTGAKSVALPDWNEVALNGRSVVLAFDCDVSTNKSVRRALEEFTRWLQSKKATVRYCVLPDLGDGKTGLDDFLGAGHTVDELRACVVDRLPPLNEQPRATTDVPEREPEDGAEVLDDLARFVGRFCVFPNEHYTTALALWIAHTHCIDAFEITPRLALVSETKQTGKSRVLEVIDLTAARSRYVASMTTAYLFRLVDQSKPSLLFDEIDAVFGPKARDHNEELRSLINVGFRRSATVGRCVGDGAKQTPTEFAAFAALAMAGIGDCVPDTVIDRSVVLRMRRRAPDEDVEPLRYRKVSGDGRELHDRLAAWGKAHTDELAHADPVMPDGITDRPADTWEALLAVAQAAGGDWPELASAACVALNDARSAEDTNVSIRLLADIRSVLRDEETHVFSATLCERLNGIEEAPWGGWSNGYGIKPRDLARRLKGFGIESKKIRIASETRQGYELAAFDDAFRRYLPSSGTSGTSGTPLISTVPDVPDVPDNERTAGTDTTEEDEPLERACERCGEPGWRFFGHTLCADHRDEFIFEEEIDDD